MDPIAKSPSSSSSQARQSSLDSVSESEGSRYRQPEEPFLLTPGPLTTAMSVKQAMLKDWGSWDDDFRAMTKLIRHALLAIIDDESGAFECIPIQGSGTYAVEAMLGSLIPHHGNVLVLANGAYGKRCAQILRVIGRSYRVLDKGDFLPPRGEEVARILADDPSITHVVAIHCETSSGILNPLGEIADAVSSAGRSLLVDSMSAFGAIPVSTKQLHYDAIVSSANKCLEGVPGFGFVLVRREILQTSEGNAHSLSLDLFDQWENMERTGQWRYTPPTHTLAAFVEALRCYEQEGGEVARGRRYADNRNTLVDGMRQLGFETLLAEDWLSPIIVTFFSPDDPKFEFSTFYQLMKAQGFIIYPGKLTEVNSFRIGCIGQIDSHVMRCVVAATDHALRQMGVTSAAPSAMALSERQKLLDNSP